MDLAGRDVTQAERIAFLAETDTRRDRLAAPRAGMGRLDRDR
jgi:hypothetical protein